MKETPKRHPLRREAQKDRHLSDKLRLTEIKELMLSRRDAEEEIELKRREAYIQRPTQRLLRNLLERGKKAQILPTYDPSSGFRYKTVESVFDGNVTPREVEEFLDGLNHLEILKKSFYETVSACPVCGSTCITLHYRCPKCSSGEIVNTGLTEHIPCGNIDERSNYVQGHCPKCKAKLVEGEYRDMGLWYICRECAEKFEHANLGLICRKCNNQFTIETANVQEVSKYALNPEKEQEIRQNVTSLESIWKLLTELGFSVEMPASVTGEKSGIQHKFSLLAKKKIGDRENVVAVDHAVGDVRVEASPLILYIYKISEVNIDLPIFVAIPRLSETAKRIAQGYNLLLVEGNPKEKEHLDTLRDEIQRRLDERIAEEFKKTLPPLELGIVHQWIFRRGKRMDVWRDHEGRFVNLKEYQSKMDSERLPSNQSSSKSQPDTKSKHQKRAFIERIKKAIKRESSRESNHLEE